MTAARGDGSPAIPGRNEVPSLPLGLTADN